MFCALPVGINDTDTRSSRVLPRLLKPNKKDQASFKRRKAEIQREEEEFEEQVTGGRGVSTVMRPVIYLFKNCRYVSSLQFLVSLFLMPLPRPIIPSP